MRRCQRRSSSWSTAAVALALLVAGCRAHAPVSAGPTAASEAGEFVPGEALVHLLPAGTPPTTVGGLRCQPGAWAADRVLILRCEPVGAGRDDTARLVEALRGTPGVQSADFNWIRRAGQAGHRSTP